MEDAEAVLVAIGAGEQLEIVLGVAALCGVGGLRVDEVADVADEPGGVLARVLARELKVHVVDGVIVDGVEG